MKTGVFPPGMASTIASKNAWISSLNRLRLEESAFFTWLRKLSSSCSAALMLKEAGPAEASRTALLSTSMRLKNARIRSISFSFGIPAPSQLSTKPAASPMRNSHSFRGSSVLK